MELEIMWAFLILHHTHAIAICFQEGHTVICSSRGMMKSALMLAEKKNVSQEANLNEYGLRKIKYIRR